MRHETNLVPRLVDAARPLLVLEGARIVAPGGRVLFDDLSLVLTREKVALVGRNGVGKSTLLATLAEDAHTARPPRFVPQRLVRAPGDRDAVRALRRFEPPHRASEAAFAAACRAVGLPAPGALARAGVVSHGELRKLALVAARVAEPDILLLDEPTDDLDDAGVEWLRAWLAAFPGCLVAATHDRRLLEDFRHFFVAREGGSFYFAGTLAELDAAQDRVHAAGEARYLRRLSEHAAREAHTLHVARRKARKKRYGRSSEIDRGTPRIRLNAKREQAQNSHGKIAKVREARLAAVRAWSRAARRALDVRLALDLAAPVLPTAPAGAAIALRGVVAAFEGRRLFGPIDLSIARDRVAVVGANGTGKTTLLAIMTGALAPTVGEAFPDAARVGVIAQGAADWCTGESLLEHLAVHASDASGADRIAALLVAHRFPFALADRPMRSLSPGERVRAALIALFERAPAVDVLVLDEPTSSLDLVGQRALARALRAWPGGLVVASHDRAFVDEVGFDHRIELALCSRG
jgi:ATPase subunit of ABC transporter with duplicated ATPase domains